MIEELLIPIIKIKHQDEQFIEWNRRRFQITPPCTMKINKGQGQGQTLIKVGIWLLEPSYTHGQLHVAASRVADPQHLHFAVNNNVCRKTRKRNPINW